MFANLPVVDLAISLVLIFLLLSIVASGFAEGIQMRLKTRSKLLYSSLNKIFNDRQNKNWADMLYRHPLINSLKKKESSNPSYIPSGVFASALIDLIIREGYEYKRDPDDPERIVVVPTTGTVVEKFRKGVNTLSPSDVRVMLFSFLENSERTMSEREAETQDSLLSKNVQKWYDSYMDRVTGWYKRGVQKWLLGIGLAIAIIFNVDTFKLIDHFLQNKDARDAAVAIAIETVDKGGPLQEFDQSMIPPDASVGEVDSIYRLYVDQQMDQSKAAKDKLLGMDVPIGWRDGKEANEWRMQNFKIKLDELKIMKDSLPQILLKVCVDSVTHIYRKKLDSLYTASGCDSCRVQENDSAPKKFNKGKKQLDLTFKCNTEDCKTMVASKKDSLENKFNAYNTEYNEGLKEKACLGLIIMSQFDGRFWIFIKTVLGWLLTAFAVSRGSAFWFENLSRLVNLRNAGKKPSSTT